jgi:[CysO sulfur-carrier protein]-S-L-cysteine hydrolase
MARSQKQPLVIAADVYDAMILHCIKGSPLACFGILAGIAPLASAIYPLRNAAESSIRYESDPQDLLRAFLDLRERGLAIVAIYHCRPGNAAVPGPTDLRENYYGDIPRVIISLGDLETDSAILP